MPTYYCHDCARAAGLLSSIYTSSLTGTACQWEKFLKHTLPDPQFNYQSVFADPSTGAYGKLIVNSAASGAVELDDLNRRNIIWYAGKTIGAGFKNGVADLPTDTTKVVLSSETGRIHGFSISSTEVRTQACGTCGKPILT
jgi:hypothetical protein